MQCSSRVIIVVTIFILGRILLIIHNGHDRSYILRSALCILIGQPSVAQTGFFVCTSAAAKHFA